MLIRQITDHGSSGFTAEFHLSDGSLFHLYGCVKLTPFQKFHQAFPDKHIYFTNSGSAAPWQILPENSPGISKFNYRSQLENCAKTRIGMDPLRIPRLLLLQIAGDVIAA